MRKSVTAITGAVKKLQKQDRVSEAHPELLY